MAADPFGPSPKKYKKDVNPNKRKTPRSGTGTKKGDAGRERNKGHPKAEEHNRDNRGRKGNRSGGGKVGGSGLILLFILPDLLEGYCAAGYLDCRTCQSLGYRYPGEGTAWDPCAPQIACSPILTDRPILWTATNARRPFS